jgi:hypothetical protein
MVNLSLLINFFHSCMIIEETILYGKNADQPCIVLHPNCVWHPCFWPFPLFPKQMKSSSGCWHQFCSKQKNQFLSLCQQLCWSDNRYNAAVSNLGYGRNLIGYPRFSSVKGFEWEYQLKYFCEIREFSFFFS